MNDFVDIDRERISNTTYAKFWQIFKEVIKDIPDANERVIAFSLYGSQNYQLDTVESDIDAELFLFPSKEDIIFNKSADKGCIDTRYGTCHIKDIRSAFNEVCKSSPNMLELLATPYMIMNVEYQRQWEQICKNVDYYALLSAPKLILGLRGLMNRYYNKLKETGNIKYAIGCLRVILMIREIMENPETFSYSDLLVQTPIVFLNRHREECDLEQVDFEYQKALADIEKFMPSVIGYSSFVYEQLRSDEIRLFNRYFTLEF